MLTNHTREIENKLIEFITNNIDTNEIELTYSKMCIERCNLHSANNRLYTKIDDLVEEFCIDNEIENDFDTEDVFEELYINI